MSVVKIRIYHVGSQNSKNEWKLVRAKYIEKDFDKKITAKKAGQILANNFPEFDRLGTRNGLQKSEEGFLAMKTLEPTEKCDYHYIWKYALVTEEDSE